MQASGKMSALHLYALDSVTSYTRTLGHLTRYYHKIILFMDIYIHIYAYPVFKTTLSYDSRHIECLFI